LENTISSGCVRQADRHETNKALNEFDSNTQKNAALVEQSSAAAQSLADEATHLVEIISAFRDNEPDVSEPKVAPKSDAKPHPYSHKGATRPARLEKARTGERGWMEL
ncbi:MAG: hypothetical protein WCF85_19285, partial [Rhodospirillaceae bacterium]